MKIVVKGVEYVGEFSDEFLAGFFCSSWDLYYGDDELFWTDVQIDSEADRSVVDDYSVCCYYAYRGPGFFRDGQITNREGFMNFLARIPDLNLEDTDTSFFKRFFVMTILPPADDYRKRKRTLCVLQTFSTVNFLRGMRSSDAWFGLMTNYSSVLDSENWSLTSVDDILLTATR